MIGPVELRAFEGAPQKRCFACLTEVLQRIWSAVRNFFFPPKQVAPPLLPPKNPTVIAPVPIPAPLPTVIAPPRSRAEVIRALVFSPEEIDLSQEVPLFLQKRHNFQQFVLGSLLHIQAPPNAFTQALKLRELFFALPEHEQQIARGHPSSLGINDLPISRGAQNLLAALFWLIGYTARD